MMPMMVLGMPMAMTMMIVMMVMISTLVATFFFLDLAARLQQLSVAILAQVSVAARACSHKLDLARHVL